MSLAMSIEGIAPLFLLANEYTYSQKERLEKAGFEALSISVKPSNTKSVCKKDEETYANIFFQNIKKRLKKMPVFRQWVKVRQLKLVEGQQETLKRQYQKLLTEIEFFFTQYSFSCVILCGDRHLNAEAVVIQLAKKQGVPIVIPPVSVFSSPEDLARLRLMKSKDLYDVTCRQELLEKFPNQFYRLQNGRYISFYPYWMIEPLSDLNLLPEHPFIMGASGADIVMFSGEHEANRSYGFGLSIEKGRLTGDSEFDDLFGAKKDTAELKSMLHKKDFINPSKKTIVVALPQLFEHGILDWESHWKVIADICQTIDQYNVNVLLSLHPKMQRNHYDVLEEQYDLLILDESLSKILPVADLFIASQGSSTWAWACLCGIPTILCDWYGLEYSDFANSEGVFIPKTVAEFQLKVEELLMDENYLKKAIVSQQDTAKKIGLFDGKAKLRIADLLVNPHC